MQEVKETTDDACNVYENVDDDDDDVSYYITFPTGGELMPPSCIFGQLHRSETLKYIYTYTAHVYSRLSQQLI